MVPPQEVAGGVGPRAVSAPSLHPLVGVALQPFVGPFAPRVGHLVAQRAPLLLLPSASPFAQFVTEVWPLFPRAGRHGTPAVAAPLVSVHRPRWLLLQPRPLP